MNSYNTNTQEDVMPTTSGYTGDPIHSTGPYKMTSCADGYKPCIAGDGIEVVQLVSGNEFPMCPLCKKNPAWFELIDADSHGDSIDPFEKLVYGENGKVDDSYRPVIRRTETD
jgi:hypothetical protein